MFDRARQTGRLFDACGVDGQLHRKKFVRPPAVFQHFFPPDEGAPLEANSQPGAVAACQVELLPQLRLQDTILAVTDYCSKDFAGQIFDLCLI